MTRPLDCELSYSAKALVRREGRWVTDQAMRAALPKVPEDFVPISGPYGQIATHARKLNDLYERRGSMPFLFHPEPRKTDRKES